MTTLLWILVALATFLLGFVLGVEAQDRKQTKDGRKVVSEFNKEIAKLTEELRNL